MSTTSDAPVPPPVLFRTENTVSGSKYVNAKPVYFPPMQGNARWANDNGNSQAWKTAVIRDKDGSLGAGPNAYVLINDGVNDSIAACTSGGGGYRVVLLPSRSAFFAFLSRAISPTAPPSFGPAACCSHQVRSAGFCWSRERASR